MTIPATDTAPILRIHGSGVAGWAAAAVLARAGHGVTVAGTAPLLPGPLPAPVPVLARLQALVGAPLDGWWPATGLWLADDWPQAQAGIAVWQPAVLAASLRAAALAAGASEAGGGQPHLRTLPAASPWRCWPGRARGGRDAWAIVACHGGEPTALLTRAPNGGVLLAGDGPPSIALTELLLGAGARWALSLGALVLDPQPARRWLSIPPPLSARPALILPEPGPLGLAALVERLAALAAGQPMPALLPEALPPIFPEETDDEGPISAAAAAACRLWQP